MAEAVGLAASVIAIVDLSAKVANLCLQYSAAVRNARADITCLRARLDDLGTSLQGIQHLLDGRNSPELTTSRKLVDSLDGCTSELGQLQSRLDPGKAHRAMRRFGLRALKWPFDSKEVSGIVSNLEHYKQTIMLCLQVDQTTLLLGIRQKIEGVSLQVEGSTSIARKPCFSVPFDRDPDFVDRPDLMAWIKKQYTGSAGRMALVGMGGFGVFWVHASSRPRFEEAYRSIAERLQLPGRNDPNVNVLRLVCDWLQTEEASSWVMVLDNVDDVNLFYPSSNFGGNKAGRCPADGNPAARSEQRPLAAFLPKRRNGTILVTSRSMDAAEKLTGSHNAVYRISTMDHAQGLQLLRNKMNGDFDKDSAADLLRALDYIPLAITQAAAYINRRAPRVSVRTYLETMQKSDKKKGSLLNSDAGDLRRDETVSNSVVTTWQVTFEQIRRERPSAANLLSFMSFFNPQGIPEFVLHNYDTDLTDTVDTVAERDDFEDDIDVLRGYSLVSMTATRDVFEMHSLVQFCTRAWISVVDDAERWRQVFLRVMSRHFPGGSFETWRTCRMLLPHIELVLGEEPPDEDLENWARLLANCAWYMFNIGKYGAAEKLGGKAVEITTRVLGKEHRDTLASMATLALIYGRQGRWKEAEELLVGVMEPSKRVLGEEHPDTLTSMHNLAVIQEKQGYTGDALPLLRNCVVLRKRVLGVNHQDAAFSAAILAKWENINRKCYTRDQINALIDEALEKHMGWGQRARS
ncbi:hypothetical protein DL769_004007 [Monosporascus sp. CRB-8-3]|nr:hypothetical protein DL769_004007 [Monosporascus sp. CRB-8-3]